jgi:hypothetical protein
MEASMTGGLAVAGHFIKDFDLATTVAMGSPSFKAAPSQ